jgi:hypothetical protein
MNPEEYLLAIRGVEAERDNYKARWHAALERTDHDAMRILELRREILNFNQIAREDVARLAERVGKLAAAIKRLMDE